MQNLGIPKQQTKTAVALGYFDGVHRGHAAVLGAAVACARENGWAATALSFDFSRCRPGAKGQKDLLAGEDTLRAMCALGIEQCIRLEFGQIAALPGREFALEALRELNAGALFCGAGFRFGESAQDGAAELREYCAELGVAFTAVGEVVDGGVISTSRIKQLVAAGDMAAAARLLGRPYGFSMIVEPGFRLGHTLGFPTINHKFAPGVLIPRFGVYRAAVELESRRYRGVCNIGTRPTVSDSGLITAETYILDFKGDVYGERAEVALLEFLRPERPFVDKDELKAAIAADVERVRRAEKGDFELIF